MNTNFIEILNKLIKEQGREALLNHAKSRRLLPDYTKNEYKKESTLILRAIEAGVAKAINTTEELELCKKQQIRTLVDEWTTGAVSAVDAVETLALVLRSEQGNETPPVYADSGEELQEEQKTSPSCSTPAISNPVSVKEIVERGKTYAAQEQYDEAIKDFSAAIRFAPNNASYYNNRGLAYHKNEALYYYKRGDAYKGYDEAIEDYSEAIRLEPNNASYYVNRAHSYYGKEQYDEAIEDFSEAIRLDPNNASTYIYRGNGYREKKTI